MEYGFILVRYGELTTKGKNRKKFITNLKDNVKYRLKAYPKLEIEATRDRMYIELNGEDWKGVTEKLQTVFGIHNFSLAMKVETKFEAMQEAVLAC
ncbi:MAG: tRNA 4-thiouridine(8) synthase ThiI, partial [Bacillaceae bacterium]